MSSIVARRRVLSGLRALSCRYDLPTSSAEVALMATPILDQWAAWLLQRRHGGDPDLLRQTMDRLATVRDRVLANSGLAHGETLLDVGCGDGLIAFGALERVGERGMACRAHRLARAHRTRSARHRIRHPAASPRARDRCSPAPGREPWRDDPSSAAGGPGPRRAAAAGARLPTGRESASP